MQLLKSKNGAEKPAKLWFVVDRGTAGATATTNTTREAALATFGSLLARSVATGETYTPYERGRRLMVLGPDHVLLGDCDSDPLVVGDAALRAALTAEEYRMWVQGPVAASLLES